MFTDGESLYKTWSKYLHKFASETHLTHYSNHYLSGQSSKSSKNSYQIPTLPLSSKKNRPFGCLIFKQLSPIFAGGNMEIVELRQIKCKFCSNQIIREEFSEHLKTCKFPEKCDSCDKVFPQRYNAKSNQNHVKLCKKYFQYFGKFGCEICGKNVTKRGFLLHFKKIHTKEVNLAEKLELNNLKSQKMKEIEKIVLESENSLNSMNEFPPQDIEFEDLTEQDWMAKIPCSICNVTFWKTDFAKHFESCQERQNSPLEEVDPAAITEVYACPLCNSKFLTEVLVNGHLQKFHRLSTKTVLETGLKIKKVII